MFALIYTLSYSEEKAEETKKIIDLINTILQLEAEQGGGIREDVEEVKEARSIMEKLKSIEDVKREIESFIPRLPNFNNIKVDIKVNTSVHLPTIAHVKVETLTLNQTTPPPYLPSPPPYPTPPPSQRAPPPQGGGGSRAMLYLAIGLMIAVVFAGLFVYELFQYQALQYKYLILQNQYNSLESAYSSLNTSYMTLKNQYNILGSNYSNLQNQYSNLQNQYSSLESEYSTLQSQYSSLQSNYNTLQESYNNLLSSITTFDSYSYNNYIGTGDTAYFPIFVPSGYTATVSIYLSSVDYFDVYVESIYGQSTSFLYYWQDFSYLSQTVTLGPGFYIIVVYNNPYYNQYGAYATIDISTTLTPTS